MTFALVVLAALWLFNCQFSSWEYLVVLSDTAVVCLSVTALRGPVVVWSRAGAVAAPGRGFFSPSVFFIFFIVSESVDACLLCSTVGGAPSRILFLVCACVYSVRDCPLYRISEERSRDAVLLIFLLNASGLRISCVF